MLFLGSVIATLNRKKVGYVVSDTCRHATLLGLLIFYAFLGAGLFFVIERPDQVVENAKNRRVASDRIKLFTQHLTAILLNECVANTTGDEILKIEERCGKIIEFEMQQEFPEIMHQDVVWNYWHALIYASTIFTTIGYGHLYCRTRLGQVVTIIYAVFGIPLTMTVLNNIGQLLYSFLRVIYKGGAKLFYKVWNASWRKAEKIDNRLSGISHYVELDLDHSPKNLPVTVAAAIMVIYTLSSAWVFLYWEEDWDYFTAIYFMFISLSTIGLGDVIPEHQMYMLSAFALILVGLALVSMCISVMQAKLERTYHEAFGTIEQSIENFKIPPLSTEGEGGEPSGPPPEKVHHVHHGRQISGGLQSHLGVFGSFDQTDLDPDSGEDGNPGVSTSPEHQSVPGDDPITEESSGSEGTGQPKTEVGLSENDPDVRNDADSKGGEDMARDRSGQPPTQSTPAKQPSGKSKKNRTKSNANSERGDSNVKLRGSEGSKKGDG